MSTLRPFARLETSGLALISISVALTHSALAATKSWSATAASASWTTAGNWSGGVPANDLTTDIALFNQTSYAFQPTAPNNRQVAGIIIGDGSTATAALDLTVGTTTNRLVLGASGIDMKAAAGAVTVGPGVNRGILLGASQTWNNDSNNSISVSSVGNFNTTTASTYTLTLTGSGSGGITLGAGVVADSTTASTGVTALTVNRSGSGAVLLNGANTYTGGTTVSAGLLQIGGVNVGSVGAITSSAIGTGALALNGGMISSNSGAARTILNAVAIGGNVTLGDATSNGVLTFSANADLGGVTRTLSTASDVVLAGTLSNGGITKVGSAQLSLSGNNSAFNGPITVNGGTLRILGNPITKSLGTGPITLTSGVLMFAPNNNVNYGNSMVVNGNSTISNNVNVNPKTMTLGDLSIGANTLTIESGTAVNTGTLALSEVAFGATTLTGASQFVVNNQVGNLVTTLFTLDSMNNGGFTPQFSGNGNITVTGAITGSGGLTLASSGTTTLSGTGSYAGSSSLNAGTVAINGNQSAAIGAVSVSNSGTRLVGTGTVGGNTTINSGAIHSAGAATPNAMGLQTFDQTGIATTDLTYGAGSIFEWDLNANKDTDSSGVRGSDYDAVDVSGTLSVNATSVLRVVLGSGVTNGDLFWQQTQTWSDIFAVGTLSGAFTNSLLQVVNPAGATYDQSLLNPGYQFSVTGTSLIWSPVPEPSSALAGLLLASGLLRRRRA